MSSSKSGVKNISKTKSKTGLTAEEKHRREVMRLRRIKRQRRMKRTERGDDILRDPNDSDDFIVNEIPMETPQDLWLNDLLGPPSLNVDSTQTSTVTQPETLGNGDHRPSNKSQTVQIQEDFSLSLLISKLWETIMENPMEFAFVILAVIICPWLYIGQTQ